MYYFVVIFSIGFKFCCFILFLVLPSACILSLILIDLSSPEVTYGFIFCFCFFLVNVLKGGCLSSVLSNKWRKVSNPKFKSLFFVARDQLIDLMSFSNSFWLKFLKSLQVDLSIVEGGLKSSKSSMKKLWKMTRDRGCYITRIAFVFVSICENIIN